MYAYTHILLPLCSNRLVNSCHAKCISEKYLEPDLNKGEGVCIDRCTAKFFEVSPVWPLYPFLFLLFFPPSSPSDPRSQSLNHALRYAWYEVKIVAHIPSHLLSRTEADRVI